MLPTSVRLMTMCLLGSLGAACGEGDGRSGGDGGGAPPDAGQWADAAPDPVCDIPALPIAWSKEFLQKFNRVTIDADGTVLVAVTDDPSRCVRLTRFAADGTEIWRHRYDPSPPPADNYKPCPSEWNAIAVGPDGTIVTIGDDVSYPDVSGPTDILLRKHDRDGNALWTYYNQNAPDGFEGSDGGADLAVARDGTIVAAGTHASRPWVARLTPDGTPLWTWVGAGAKATDVAVAADGTAFVSITTGGFDPRYRIARFDPDGTETTIAEVFLATAHPIKLATTADGGLVFVVRAAAPLLRKIDGSGALVWDQDMCAALDRQCGPIELSPWSLGIVNAPDGTIHVAVNGGVYDDVPSTTGGVILARFSGDGELLSSHVHPGHYLDDLAVGPDGGIALTDRRDLVVSAPLDGSP